jgi:hypothetical protein
MTNVHAYTALVTETEGKEPPGRTRIIQNDIIKVNVKEIGCGVAEWIHLAQDREQWLATVNNVTMKLHVP